MAIVLVAVDEVHIFFLTVVSLAASYKGRLTTFIICCIIFLINLLIRLLASHRRAIVVDASLGLGEARLVLNLTRADLSLVRLRGETLILTAQMLVGLADRE